MPDFQKEFDRPSRGLTNDDLTAEQPKSSFDSLQTKAGLASTALALAVAFWAVEAVSGLYFLSGSEDAFGWLDFLPQIETFYPLLFLACATLFITWSYGAHANLKRLGRTGIRHQDQATIWWWIVPIANLFVPFQVVNETVRGSQAPLDDLNWKSTPVPSFVKWWGPLFVTGVLLNGVGTNMLTATLSDPSGTNFELNGVLAILLIGALAMVGAGTIAILLVGRVTEGQVNLGRQMGSKTFPLNGGDESAETWTFTSSSQTEDSPEPKGTPMADRTKTFCTSCGVRYEVDDRFCANCGAAR